MSKEEIREIACNHIDVMHETSGIMEYGIRCYTAGYNDADQQSAQIAVAFGNWLKKTVFDGDVPDLYQYFIENIYNK